MTLLNDMRGKSSCLSFQIELLSINVSKLIYNFWMLQFLFCHTITLKIADKRQATSIFAQLYYLSSNATHACHHRLRTLNEDINKNKSLKSLSEYGRALQAIYLSLIRPSCLSLGSVTIKHPLNIDKSCFS